MPRYDVIGQLESQITLSTGCPGIVLYGRRRVGKSTILKNLVGFLPVEVLTVRASMQHPGAFTSAESFVKFLSGLIAEAVGGQDSPDGLQTFYRFLADCDGKLERAGKRLLIAVDEYENIDRKLSENVFPPELLDVVRESIQEHRRLIWLFAGSHEISELSGAPWTSYLVSARTVEAPMFTYAETELLLTDPLKFSSRWAKNSQRPRFSPGFWGPHGIERIQRESGGWPHLVQLLAESVIDLINAEGAREVSADLLEQALRASVVRGHNVFYELMRRESTPGEWDYLAGFVRREAQPAPGDARVAALLHRRLLVEVEDDRWRLRVPLMRRWLVERGAYL